MSSSDSVVEAASVSTVARGPAGRLRALVRASNLALTAIAAMVGAAAGLMVFLLSRTVQWMHATLFGIDLNERLSGAAHLSPIAVLVWPTLGGLLVGISVWLRRRAGRPPAVDPIEANALRGGRMSISDSVAVALQTLASNGFGGSVGLEAGYTQAGSGLASALGVQLKLRRADLRVLVGSGAAGAIAAAFAAPLTGAFYGFEVVIGAYAIANVAPVMAAAIAGALVTQEIGGSLYHIEASTTAVVKGLDYGLFAALGVICAVLAILWMRAVSTLERLLSHSLVPAPVRPALGGLIVGLLALLSPQALSAGHGALQYDLAATQALGTVILLLAIKMLASAVSLGSGFRGGMFFASLLTGALTGIAFAQVGALTGWVHLDQTEAALVGMGAMAVGVVGGPFTMSFLVLETTGDYALTGAVLAASVLAGVIVREAFGYSFSTFRLHLRGESIRSARDVGWIRSLTVGRLMRSGPPLAPASTTLKDLRGRFPLGSHQWVVLQDETGRYAGMAALAEVYAPDADDSKPASGIARLPESVLLPAMNIKQAMAVFDRVEAETLAVVDSLQSLKVLGLLSETFAVRRYAEELDKSRRELIGEPDLVDDPA